MHRGVVRFMKLENLLLQKRPAILERWLDLLFETYPAESSNFLKRKKGRFINPVGDTITQEMGSLYDELLLGWDPEKISIFLDKIVRIRAVQEFSPSKALAFIYQLKHVVREEVEQEVRNEGIQEKLADFEARIDDLALLGFDLYVKCREKIFELRANEIKDRAYMLLKRANMICETPGG